MDDLVKRLRQKHNYLYGADDKRIVYKYPSDDEKLRAYAKHERDLGYEAGYADAMQEKQP